MYKSDIEQLSVESKYNLEEMIEDYKSMVYNPDFIGLLEESFRKTFLDSEEISYLYKAFYLPINKFRETMNNYEQSGITEESELLKNLKNDFIGSNFNIYSDNGKYIDKIVLSRMEDIRQIDEYKKEIQMKMSIK